MGLFCPELTNSLKGRKPPQALQTLGKVVRVEDGQVCAQTFVALVIEPPDGRLFDGAVHPFDLPVRPRMIEFRQPMLDAVLSTDEIEGMGEKPSMFGEHLSNFLDAPAAFRRRELKPVVPSEREVMTRQALL